MVSPFVLGMSGDCLAAWPAVLDHAQRDEPPGGLETGRLVAELIAESDDLGTRGPALLREHYGESFSIARRLAGLVTVPHLLPALGPAGMRSDWLMTLALRWMGNLVTDDDRDRAARVWRWAGRRSLARDARPPFC